MDGQTARRAGQSAGGVPIVARLIKDVESHAGPLRCVGKRHDSRRLGVAAEATRCQEHRLWTADPLQAGQQRLDAGELAIQRGTSDVERFDLGEARRRLGASRHRRRCLEIGSGRQPRMRALNRLQELGTLRQETVVHKLPVDDHAAEIAGLKRVGEERDGRGLQTLQGAGRQLLIIEDHDEHAGRRLGAHHHERQTRRDHGQPCRHSRMLFCAPKGVTRISAHPRHPARSAAGRLEPAPLSRRARLGGGGAAADRHAGVGSGAAISRTNQDHRSQAAAHPSRERLGHLRGLRRQPSRRPHRRRRDHGDLHRPGPDRDRTGPQPRGARRGEGLSGRQGSVRHQPAHGDAVRRRPRGRRAHRRRGGRPASRSRSGISSARPRISRSTNSGAGPAIGSCPTRACSGSGPRSSAPRRR